MTDGPREHGKYLVIYKRQTGKRARQKVNVEGDLTQVRVGDVVSFHDGTGHASAFVAHVAISARKLKTVPHVYRGYVLRTSKVLTFERISEVLRPNDNSVQRPKPAKRLPPRELSDEEKQRQEELQAAKLVDEKRRAKKAAAFKKAQDKGTKQKMKLQRETRLRELRDAATMSP